MSLLDLGGSFPGTQLEGEAPFADVSLVARLQTAPT